MVLHDTTLSTRIIRIYGVYDAYKIYHNNIKENHKKKKKCSIRRPNNYRDLVAQGNIVVITWFKNKIR